MNESFLDTPALGLGIGLLLASWRMSLADRLAASRSPSTTPTPRDLCSHPPADYVEHKKYVDRLVSTNEHSEKNLLRALREAAELRKEVMRLRNGTSRTCTKSTGSAMVGESLVCETCSEVARFVFVSLDTVLAAACDEHRVAEVQRIANLAWEVPHPMGSWADFAELKVESWVNLSPIMNCGGPHVWGTPINLDTGEAGPSPD